MPHKRNEVVLPVHADLVGLTKGELRKQIAAMRRHFKAAMFPHIVDVTITISGKPKAWETMRIIIDTKG